MNYWVLGGIQVCFLNIFVPQNLQVKCILSVAIIMKFNKLKLMKIKSLFSPSLPVACLRVFSQTCTRKRARRCEKLSVVQKPYEVNEILVYSNIERRLLGIHWSCESWLFYPNGKELYCPQWAGDAHFLRIKSLIGFRKEKWELRSAFHSQGEQWDSEFSAVFLFIHVPVYKNLSPSSGFYLRGMNREEWVAPIPGRPCLTGL